MNISNYGFTNIKTEDKTVPARITAVHRNRFEIVFEHGETHAQLKQGAFYDNNAPYPTTGDFVSIIYNPHGDSLITKILPRKSYFARKDPTPGRGEQAVAANFDYVFIMQSLNQDFNKNRLERYLTLAWQSGAQPVVLLTKADLTEDRSKIIYAAQSAAVDVAVHTVSSKTGAGLEAISAYFQPGNTVVFLGSSGVGKSSLVNAIAGEDIMRVNSIREADSKGRHTTTHRQLIMLENGAMIIDTPGMRELGLWNAGEGLGEAFADVEKYICNCRFTDCKHQGEPGCAIIAAIKKGELSVDRWESYRSLTLEAKLADDKAEFLRNKWERNKAISQKSKKMKKDGMIRK